MGLIKATFNAIGGKFGDAWLEVLEADNMDDNTVFTSAVQVRSNSKRNSNKKGEENIISNGSIIHVYPNQCMLLLDGGKIVDYTAEEGYYKVDKSSTPSLFNGELGKSIKDTFQRIKFSGIPSQAQKAVFINLQEIKGIKFGTRNPVNYFDNFYNSELFIRAHGTYSIKIVDPLKFFTEAIPRNAQRVQIQDINEQYLNEFLEGLQVSINKMSADGVRISYVTSKASEISRYMRDALDEDWRNMRGMEIQAVAIGSVSYDEESQKLINMRNQGAMLGDPTVQRGYVAGAAARGLEAAGSNPNGAMNAFMGFGMGQMAAGNLFGQVASAPAPQQQQQAPQQAAPQSGGANSWTCECGSVNTGKFCPSCGKPKPVQQYWFCPECGNKNGADTKFCPECGTRRPS
jgi:membrane protease subunit (stomatin/prohibitin family)